jgi:hypothetical protein
MVLYALTIAVLFRLQTIFRYVAFPTTYERQDVIQIALKRLLERGGLSDLALPLCDKIKNC